MSATPKEEVAVVHTLLTREIRPIRNWHEWFARWQEAKDLQWMESLLHVGFSVPLERAAYGEKEYDEIDRVIFYLSIADGWADASLLELPTDGGARYFMGYDSNMNRIEKTPREVRQQLAQKAFKELCLNFFKVELSAGGRHDDEFSRVWLEFAISERLFPVIQRFFRVEDNRSGIVNLSNWRKEEIHSQQEAVAFLVKLAKFVWGWREPARYYGADSEQAMKHFASIRVRVDAAKPWMIEVLVSLKQLDVVRGWMLKLDKACLAKLREIAFRSRLTPCMHHVKGDRLVATLDEACFVGSKAALFLRDHELMARESKRLQAIREAQDKMEAAAEQIEELTAKK